MKIFKYSFLLFILGCNSLIQTPPPPLSLPLTKYRITGVYAPLSRYEHQGIDLSAPKGTPVKSAHDGKVIYASNRLSFYGKTVIVEYSKYWSSLYAHLDSIKISEGQKISKGQIIGTVGRTGRVTGVHLHFELIYKKQPVNPKFYLKL